VQNELTVRQIVDGISAPLAVMTPDGALEIVNRPILEYFGKTADELKDWTSTDAATALDGVTLAQRRGGRASVPVRRRCDQIQ